MNPAVTLLRRSLSYPKANILINDSGRACLADFGLLRIISNEVSMTATATGSSKAQWTSPELLVPQKFGLEESHPTKKSDCYALGMTIYEVLIGRTPFSECSALAVTWKILEGERPTRPQGAEGAWFTDVIWGTLEDCWKPQPSDRITVDAVLLGLEKSVSSSKPSSDVGGLGGGATSTDEPMDAMVSNSRVFSSSRPGLISDYLCSIVEC